MDEKTKQSILKQTGELSAYLSGKQEAKRVRFEARQPARERQRAYIQGRLAEQKEALGDKGTLQPPP
jgi:hypothetical protein